MILGLSAADPRGVVASFILVVFRGFWGCWVWVLAVIGMYLFDTMRSLLRSSLFATVSQ